MEDLVKILDRLTMLEQQEPMHENCRLKINRAEVSPIQAFIKGKDEGARLLAIELLEVLGRIDGTH